MTNLKQIFTAMTEYASDYEGTICPYWNYFGGGKTWTELFKPYTKGGKDPGWQRKTKEGNYVLYEYMLLYYPTWHAMGARFSMSGYYTNYSPNARVM